MKKPNLVTGLYYPPRQDDTLNGTIGAFTIETSLNGADWS